MRIEQANQDDLSEWLRMARLLWPEDSDAVLRQEWEEMLTSDHQTTFFGEDDDGRHVAFVAVSVRSDYVEESNSRPVGYLEGLYVDEEYRHRGIGKRLVQVAESWAKERGCKEMGSDTWDWNTDSIAFHEKVGFTKGETLVHFIKRIS